MAQFLTESVLLAEAARSGTATSHSAKQALMEGATQRRYDYFMSHASIDLRLVKAVRDRLVARGYSVYGDWLDASLLNQAGVTRSTAALLRRRMDSSDALLFVSTQAAANSAWMPWELGYFDGRNGEDRIGIVPILDMSGRPFQGHEHLAMYPQFQAEEQTTWSDFVVTDTAGRITQRVGSLRRRL